MIFAEGCKELFAELRFEPIVLLGESIFGCVGPRGYGVVETVGEIFGDSSKGGAVDWLELLGRRVNKETLVPVLVELVQERTESAVEVRTTHLHLDLELWK